MKVNQLIIVVIASLFSAIAAVGLYNLFDKDKVIYSTPLAPGSFETVAYDEGDAKTSTIPFDFTKAAKIGLPSVVHIRSTVERQSNDDSRSYQDLFEDFFGRRSPSQPRGSQRGYGFGSGVVISADGYIITNNHVIEEANDIQVAFYNDEVIEAKLIGTDPTTDIALIKVDKKNLPHLQFADSDLLEVGEWVAAIGNPAVGPDAFALKSTVTAGIVSATGRNIGINEELYKIESFIQTDAVINKGNSGGALVNVNGDLVGINTAISTPTGVYAGYGFAVPSNLARKVVSDLKEYGEVQRALLGISYQDIKAVKSAGGNVNSKEEEGLLISSVSPDGSADKAGLKVGDVIVKLDGEDITDQRMRNFQEIIGRKRPGDIVNVEYKRDGKTNNAKIKLLSAEVVTQAIEEARKSNSVEELGVILEPLTSSQLRKFGIDSGVRISESRRDGLLYNMSSGDAGPGFIITHINGQEVSSVEQVREAIENANSSMVSISGFNEDSPNSKSRFSFPLR